ncbi:extracellular solute-binding protein [soil metagenome]
MRQRPLRGLALFTMLSLAIAACGGPGATSAPTTGVAPSVPASQPVESEPAESEPAESEPAESEPAESPDTSPEPLPSDPVGNAEISGEIQVGAQFAEGADEIATTRYDMFIERYPGVTINWTESGFDPATFLTSVAAGEQPDVVRMDREIISTYIAEGALMPVDQCITDRQIDMGQYYDSAVAQVTFDGQVYGIPEDYSTRIILINDSVLAEVELTPEDIDTSDWEALSAVNEQLLSVEGGQISRLGFDPKLPEFFPLWVHANGAALVSEDGLTAQLDSPGVVEALDYAVSLITAHGNPAAFFDFRATGPGSAFFGEENQFTEDSLGAFPMEQWYLNVLAADTPDEEVSFQPFRARDGSEITFASGAAWAIPVGTENYAAACEFIRVVTRPEAWVAAAQVRADARAETGEPFTGTFTANEEANDIIFSSLVTEENAGAYYPHVQKVVELMPDAHSLPAVPNGEAFRRIWQEAVQRALNEGVPAAEALADAQLEAQDAIDQGAP